MINKKILLFARDPGGSNSISPLSNFLEENGFELLLYAKDFALNRMRTYFGINPQDVCEEVQQISKADIKKWIESKNLSAVITGTSFGDFTERYIWSVCQNLKIPCIAIVDHWINYGIRFKEDSGEYIFPDLIVVPNSDAKVLAIQDGLPSDRLRVWGNPYYDHLLSRPLGPEPENIRHHYLKDSNGILISFASEPFSLTPENYGYNEQEILSALIVSLKKNISDKQVISLVVRPHPKESKEALENIAKTSSSENFKILISSRENPIDLILASDLVCGMISQYLIEGSILGKPVLSLQIGLNKKDPFILTQKGIVPLIISTHDLDRSLEEFHNGLLKTPNFQISPNCMSEIYSELKRII